MSQLSRPTKIVVAVALLFGLAAAAPRPVNRPVSNSAVAGARACGASVPADTIELSHVGDGLGATTYRVRCADGSVLVVAR